MIKPKLKTRQEAIKEVLAAGEPIEPNAHCEALIEAALRNELQDLLNDKEEYQWG